MKAPVKPIKPSKPYPPNKDQKVHSHKIDITHLFIKEIYYDENGDEISEEKYEADGDCADIETKEYTPRLTDLLKLVPPHINDEDIFIELSLDYDSSHNYQTRPFEGASVFYTTPYIYQDELDKYKKQLDQYDLDILDYNKKIKEYKVKWKEYQEYKEKLRLEKKKSLLKKQLQALEKKE